MKSRCQIELNSHFHKRWLSYAAAAGSGAGILTAAAPAKADIIYKYTDTSIPINGSFTLSLDGANALTLTNVATVQVRVASTLEGGVLNHHSGGAAMNIKSAGLIVGGNASAGRLPFGAFIGSYQKGGFIAGGGRMGSVKGTFGTTGSTRVYYPGMGFRTHIINHLHPFAESQIAGSWATTGSGYLGFLFSAADGFHYGWASVVITERTSETSVSYQEVLNGYAYNSDPNAPITAGEGSAPEPGTLGLLALGSLGLYFWRRKQMPAAK